MSAVVVVTRGGEGAVFRFASVAAADEHPVVQFGDPILRSVDDLRDSFSLHEWARLALEVDDQKLSAEISRTPSDSRYARESVSARLWDELVRDAQEPPTDPAEIVDIVVADRRRTRVTGVKMRRRSEAMSEAVQNTDATQTAATKRPIPKDPKYSPTAIVTMGKDKDGKPYGADNNPKKVGSASADRFAKYVDGKTVQETLDAGITRADLDHDVKKNFISIA